MFSVPKKVSICLGFLIIALLSGCGGDSSSPNLTIALSVLNSAPLTTCPNGGITIQSGVDKNSDQVLNEPEVTSQQFICNGAAGANGSNSLNSLIAIKPEPIGANCNSGGSEVNVGLDTNKNTILDALEITSVTYVCNGVSSAAAINGVSGSPGINGTNGTAGTSGATGSTGATGSIGATGTAGANGTNGTAGGVGATGSAGANGSIGATGTAGLVSLVSITSESSGANCAYAGLKVSSGIDANADDSLALSEIKSTEYVCNGAPASTAFAYVYNLREQTVEIDKPVVFDSTGAISGISHTNRTAEIIIGSPGIYMFTYSISGTGPNQFALFVNRVVLSQSVYGSGADTQQNNGQVIVELRAEDIVTLVNVTGATAVGLASKIGGDKVNVNASITILKLNP